MKEKKIKVVKLSVPNIENSCVQVMIPYKKRLTTISTEGIIYHKAPGSAYINTYQADNRRMWFPYGNIPEHMEFWKTQIANHILDTYIPYVIICDGNVSKVSVHTQNDDLYMVNTKLEFEAAKEKTISRSELLELFTSDSVNTKFIFNSEGVLCEAGNEDFIPTEEKIVEIVKERISKSVFIQSRTEGPKNVYAQRFLNHTLENLTIDGVPCDTEFMPDDLLIVTCDNSIVQVEKVRVRFMGIDSYKVIISRCPVNVSNLKTVQGLIDRNKYKMQSQPHFPAILNPSIDKKDVRAGKGFYLQKLGK